MISDAPVTTDTIIKILTIVVTMSSVLFVIQSSQSFCEVYKWKPVFQNAKSIWLWLNWTMFYLWFFKSHDLTATQKNNGVKTDFSYSL